MVVIFRRFACGGASSPCFAAGVVVSDGANAGSPLGFFFTMTPLSAFLTDRPSFLEAGVVTLFWSSLPGLDGAEGFETTGGGLLMAFSLAATALRGKLT